MSLISNFVDANRALHGFIPPDAGREPQYSLHRMKSLMTYLGDPQNKLKIVHVAGTSGKTSTSYYIAALLTQSGAKVGLSISPHIDEINERVQINMQPLVEGEFCHQLEKFLALIQKSGLSPTYFEVLIAFAFWVFEKQAVEYAVMEVGLGGLLDGTNVIEREDKICVITDIGLDHTNILGTTPQEITAQKAGIIHKHNTVFTNTQPQEIMKVIRRRTTQKEGRLIIVAHQESTKLDNLPPFQLRNFHLAHTVFDYLAQRDKLKSLTRLQVRATSQTYIPGRMEVVSWKQKTIVLDGSHNQQKLHAFVEGVQRILPQKSIVLLVSFDHTRAPFIQQSLLELRKLSSNIILTKFHLSQDEPRHAIDPNALSNYCKELGFTSIEIESDPKKAFYKLMGSSNQLLVITGSFYLLNHIRPLLAINV